MINEKVLRLGSGATLDMNMLMKYSGHGKCRQIILEVGWGYGEIVSSLESFAKEHRWITSMETASNWMAYYSGYRYDLALRKP